MPCKSQDIPRHQDRLQEKGNDIRHGSWPRAIIRRQIHYRGASVIRFSSEQQSFVSGDNDKSGCASVLSHES